MNLKKWFLSILIASIFIISPGCQKNYEPSEKHASSLVEAAKEYFNTAIYSQAVYSQAASDSSNNSKRPNPRKTSLKAPDWDKAYTTHISVGDAVVVPVHFKKPFLIRSNFGGDKLYSVDELTKLLIYKDTTSKFHVEVVTLLPDSSYANQRGHSFSGIAFVEDWWGNPINKYQYLPTGTIRKYDVSKHQEQSGPSELSRAARASSQIIEVCYEIYGYNYSVDDPENGYYWSEFAGCSIYFVDQEVQSYFTDGGGGDYGRMGGGGGGGGGDGSNPGISVADAVTVLPGTGVIGNIKDYNKCFDNIPSSNYTYQVSICVSQPNPGARDAWTFNSSGGSSNTGNPFFVGHTFMVLTETSPSKTIARNVGFYPSGKVTPSSPTAVGALNNDESHDYNISLTINLNSSEFTSLLNYIEQINTTGVTYNLNTYNCTTFAINALGNIGINLPKTTGSWFNGGGYNPGDFGEDIRQMQLGSNMTRSTNEKSHPNRGTCY